MSSDLSGTVWWFSDLSGAVCKTVELSGTVGGPLFEDAIILNKDNRNAKHIAWK